MTAALDHGEVAARWRTLRASRPAVRACDAAAELRVSEAELIAAMVGDCAVRLDANPADLLSALTHVGRCRALTRNEHAVSEVHGRYRGIELGLHAARVIGEQFDLRVFLDHWRNLYAIDEPDPRRHGERRRSIHAFDRTGIAIHKVTLEPDGDAQTWDAIVATRTISAPLVLQPAPPRRAERSDAAVDREVLIARWDAMQDTHEFLHLLAEHRVTRTQALRLAGPTRARRVDDDAIEHVLDATAESSAPIRIFVGNRGCIQAFSGAVGRIVPHGPWLDVQGPGFNLHLRTDRIASTWVVHKPTRAGAVSSLELFDAAGETIALVFQERSDRSRPEDPAWRAMLDRLPGVPQ